jgi:hypothetical protein
MKVATKRASLAELKKFANQVRKAGGGNPLDALMPAIPADPQQCLIAKNLNFNCFVNPDSQDRWAMWTDEATRDRIANKLGLKKVDEVTFGEEIEYGVVLPGAIGKVAADFDAWNEAIDQSYDPVRCDHVMRLKKNAPAQLKRLKEFWPYIDASEKEAYAKADFVNDKGELIL